MSETESSSEGEELDQQKRITKTGREWSSCRVRKPGSALKGEQWAGDDMTKDTQKEGMVAVFLNTRRLQKRGGAVVTHMEEGMWGDFKKLKADWVGLPGLLC